MPLPPPLGQPLPRQQLAKRALWWVLRRQHQQPQVGAAAGVKAEAGVVLLAGAVPCCMAAALACSSQQNWQLLRAKQSLQAAPEAAEAAGEPGVDGMAGVLGGQTSASTHRQALHQQQQGRLQRLALPPLAAAAVA